MQVTKKASNESKAYGITVEQPALHPASKIETEWTWRRNLPSVELQRALSHTRLKYSSKPNTIYSAIPMDDAVIGVFGDCHNVCYEWFIFRQDGSLTHSDEAHGSTDSAMRGLMKHWLLTLDTYMWGTGEREQFQAQINDLV